MGLDWIAYSVTDAKSTENKPDGKDHEYSTMFRGEELNDTQLPDNIVRKAYTNMNPPLMTDYATELTMELQKNERKYDDYDTQIITRAAEWLRYWANEERHVEAWF